MGFVLGKAWFCSEVSFVVFHDRAASASSFSAMIFFVLCQAFSLLLLYSPFLLYWSICRKTIACFQTRFVLSTIFENIYTFFYDNTLFCYIYASASHGFMYAVYLMGDKCISNFPSRSSGWSQSDLKCLAGKLTKEKDNMGCGKLKLQRYETWIQQRMNNIKAVLGCCEQYPRIVKVEEIRGDGSEEREDRGKQSASPL